MHKVEKGETIWGILRKRKLASSPENIKKVITDNNLKTRKKITLIYPGQELRLKDLRVDLLSRQKESELLNLKNNSFKYSIPNTGYFADKIEIYDLKRSPQKESVYELKINYTRYPLKNYCIGLELEYVGGNLRINNLILDTQNIRGGWNRLLRTNLGALKNISVYLTEVIKQEKNEVFKTFLTELQTACNKYFKSKDGLFPFRWK